MRFVNYPFYSFHFLSILQLDLVIFFLYFFLSWFLSLVLSLYLLLPFGQRTIFIFQFLEFLDEITLVLFGYFQGLFMLDFLIHSHFWIHIGNLNRIFQFFDDVPGSLQLLSLLLYLFLQLKLLLFDLPDSSVSLLYMLLILLYLIFQVSVLG